MLTQSYAASTVRNYNSKMRLFLTFLNQYDLITTDWNGANPTIPDVTPTVLMFFCTFMVMRGMKSSASIAGHCSAVKQWCLLNDRPDPVINPRSGAVDTRHHRMHRAIKRKLGTKITRREPLSVTGLRTLLAVFRSGFIVHQCMMLDFAAALLLGFYAMLRMSEFTNLTTTVHVQFKEACRNDMSFFGPADRPDGFRFVVKCSKNDQFRVTQTLTVFRSTDSKLCPVSAMHALFQQDPRPPNAPLFDFTRRTDNRADRRVSAARTWFTREFQGAIVFAGMSTAKTQSHSLRSGGATAYLRAGVDPYIIQRMGRWRSWCWQIYTWTSAIHIQQAMESVAGATTSDIVNLEQVRW